MLISELGIRGFKSYGNNEQILKLNTENGELILLVGSNGSGKCVDKKTLIEIDIDDILLSNELINFLDTTGKGRRIFLYIMENKPLLYEKIKKYRRDNISK
jgi:ABC-type sugar transport system ATPase subunit